MGTRRQQGFTVIELMITVGVMALLATLAAPLLRTTQANGRVSAASNDLVADLMRARSEAIARRHYVQVLATDTSSWGNKGWVLNDMGVNGSSTAAQIGLRGGLGTVTTATTPAATSTVWFTPTGLAQTALGGAALDVQFKVCDSSVSTETGRTVTLTRFGRLMNVRHPDPSVCAS